MKKKVDRIFRSYRCDDEESTLSSQRVGSLDSPPNSNSPLWQLSPDHIRQETPSNLVRDSSAELFLQLPPSLIRPLAISVNSGRQQSITCIIYIIFIIVYLLKLVN